MPEEIVENTVNVSEKDRAKFFEAIMEDKPFVGTVELFEGKIKALFRDSYAEEIGAMTSLVTDSEPKNALEMDTLMLKFSLAASLSSLEVEGQTISYELSDGVKSEMGPLEQLQRRANNLDRFSRSKYMVLSQALGSFDEKLAELTKLAQDPSFFSTTPNVSSESQPSLTE